MTEKRFMRYGSATALLWAVVLFLLDLITKQTVTTLFDLREMRDVTAFLNVGYWLNPGAAFSFLSNAGGWQRYFLSAVALLAVLWLCIELMINQKLNNATQIAFALIAGGAAGNLHDRVVRGSVVDWIDLHWQTWHWPAFNIADCGIVIGAGLIIYASIRDGIANGSPKSTNKQ